MPLRTGDTVKHIPTGETWVVAYADHERGKLAWCGWPEGEANIGDCLLLEQATDEQYLSLLREIAEMTGADRRGRMARLALSRMESPDA